MTADDATLRWALADAQSAALMAALVHIEGSSSILRGEIRPMPDMFGYDEDGLSAAARAQLHDYAFNALRAYRDRGCTLPPAPDAATIREILDFIGGEPAPAQSHGMLEEELALRDDPRAPALQDIPRAQRERFRVLIIGAGMSGILAAHRCRQAGLSFTVLEKNPEPGGTWYENTYPGCRVDSYNHVYAYSFLPYNDWPMYFSRREDIARYFEHCITRFGIRDDIRLGVSAREAEWDESAALWRVTAQRADGATELLEADALITATGQLNIPRAPDIEGLDGFTGPAFHSARWDDSVDLTGRRVAVIGTGASATQFVPEIVDRVASLDVYQRTPPWLLPSPRYHQPISDQQRWLFQHVPCYERWFRLWTFRVQAVDGALPALRGEEGWQGGPGAVGAGNAELRALLEDYIRGQLQDRPDLLSHSIPDYPPGGKRPLRDCGVWLDALKQPNVRLITDRITAVTGRGLRTADGVEHPADVLIYGTGFHADQFLWPMKIRGRGGLALEDAWAEAPRAFKGICVPGFPNLFCLYGPNTNIVVGSSIIFFAECQVRYVMQCIGQMLRNRQRAMEVRQAAHDAYNRMIDEGNARMAWGAPNVASWYKNAQGHVTQNWPGTHLEYWEQTRSPDPADFDFR